MDALNVSTAPAPTPARPAPAAPSETPPDIDLSQIDVSAFGFTPPAAAPRPAAPAPGPEASDFSSLGTVPPPLVSAAANFTAASSRSLTWQVAAQVNTPAEPEPLDISTLDLSQFGFSPPTAPEPEPLDVSTLDMSQFGFSPPSAPTADALDISTLDLSQFGFSPTTAPEPEPLDVSTLDMSQFGFSPPSAPTAEALDLSQFGLSPDPGPGPSGTLSGGSLIQFAGQPEKVTSQGKSVQETRYNIFDGENFVRSPLALREGNARFGFSSSDQVQVYEIDKKGKPLLRNAPIYDQQDRANAAKIPEALAYIQDNPGYTKGKSYYVVFDENNRKFIFEKNLAVESTGMTPDQTVPGKLVSVDRTLVSGGTAESDTTGLENQFASVTTGIFNDLGDFLNRIALDRFTTDRSEAQTAVARVANLADSIDTLLAAPADSKVDLSRADYGAFQKLRSKGTVTVEQARLLVVEQLTHELESSQVAGLINDYAKDSGRTGAILKAAAATAVGLAIGPAFTAAGVTGLAGSAASGAFASALVDAIEQGSTGQVSYARLVENAANGALLGAALNNLGLTGNQEALAGFLHDSAVAFG